MALQLYIPPSLADKMDRALILEEDAHRTILYCENTGVKLLDNDTGELVGHLREGALTYWVRYRRENGSFRLSTIYSHRVKLEDAFLAANDAAQTSNMTCVKCDAALFELKTVFTYLQFTFTAPLPRCPVCGQVYISEEYVTGKLNDVEETLEDK
jgi:hypothetical protein